jgi:hypothetical protein
MNILFNNTTTKINDIYICSELCRICYKGDTHIKTELEKLDANIIQIHHTIKLPLYDYNIYGINSFQHYIFLNRNDNGKIYVIFKGNYDLFEVNNKYIVKNERTRILYNNNTYSLEYNKIIKYIHDTIYNHISSVINNFSKIIFTGHDIGGIIAQTFTLTIAKANPFMEVKLITYGIPKSVCNTTKNLMSEIKNINIYHVINEYDIIHDLKFSLKKAKHSGTHLSKIFLGELYLKRKRTKLVHLYKIKEALKELIFKKILKKKYFLKSHSMTSYSNLIKKYKQDLWVYV